MIVLVVVTEKRNTVVIPYNSFQVKEKRSLYFLSFSVNNYSRTPLPRSLDKRLLRNVTRHVVQYVVIIGF